jgi:phosphomannomutase
MVSSGPPVLARLDDLARRYGRHVTRQRSIRVEGTDALATMKEMMAALRAAPPERLAGRAVTTYDDLLVEGGPLPPADVLRFRLGEDARVIVRPSGTEPKVKLYVEVVVPPDQDGEAEIEALLAALPLGSTGQTSP